MSRACPDEESLSALVDSELSPRRRILIARHIFECPDCSRVCGQVLAARRMVERTEPDAEMPTALWDRIHKSLDSVDSMAEALRISSVRRSHRRIPVVMGVGLAAILVAVIWAHQVSLSPAANPQFLVQAHMLASAADGDSGGAEIGYNAIGAEDDVPRWMGVRRGLLKVDGGFVEQIVYRVGHLPVSQFNNLPPGALAGPMQPVDAWGSRLNVAVSGDTSVVAWQTADGGLHVLVARTSPDHLLQLAHMKAVADGGY